tara:strand:- start:148 stop:1296 length:1149 start_codon:yes stop_codon:yes gene_type:complete
MNEFKLVATSGTARAAEFNTLHGRVSTPVFMPVGTQATVKALSPEEVKATGASIILGNAYHLSLQPGVSLISQFGGLHTFMNWDKPILTDSGGFQAFSLSQTNKITDDGITFKSHSDGALHFIDPKQATLNQIKIGADIIMCFDHCIEYGASPHEVESAMIRTHKWATICQETFATSGDRNKQALFGIIQGGTSRELRLQSLDFLSSLDFEGYAIGGLAVGETKSKMYETVSICNQNLPIEKPRYLMGVGSPEDLIEGVASGVDMFDCVMPTRVARNGSLYTITGRINITNQRFKSQDIPIDPDCNCMLCRNYSTAYLHHLFKAKELLALRLASIHNLTFMANLMKQIRESIVEDKFESFRTIFWAQYQTANNSKNDSKKNQ